MASGFHPVWTSRFRSRPQRETKRCFWPESFSGATRHRRKADCGVSVAREYVEPAGRSSSHPPTSRKGPSPTRLWPALFLQGALETRQTKAEPADLTPATASNDFTAPRSTIQTPVSGATLQTGAQVLITGNASDSGGQVWAVEVSTDGGNTWQPAVGQTSWSFAWIPAVSGSATIKSRAFDDSGNLETPGAGVTVSIARSQLTIWPNSTLPARLWTGS